MSRGSRYNEDQIMKVLQEIETGGSVASVPRSPSRTCPSSASKLLPLAQ
ncbi:MAG: hypothetical protein H0W86_06670 [Armatimonadetes bacterium]|nr:hypothetical protein [Armatimonadota bacterium]